MFLRHFYLLAFLGISAAAQSATVPLILEGNVPMIGLEFTSPDGATHTARFLVDTGGGAFIVSKNLAKAIGLKPSGPTSTGDGAQYAPAAAPEVRMGGMQLDLRGARVTIQLSPERFMSRDAVDGLLPGHVLERYHVIFDYPGHTFTLAAPGSVRPHGIAVPSPFRHENGFPRVNVAIGDRRLGFLLDTGASYTMISSAAVGWSVVEAKPWPRRLGAVGPANMGLPGDSKGLMLRMPEVRLGDFVLRDVGAVTRPEGTFEKWMSNMMVAPVVGALGGNVLRQFRVEIDYAAGVTYLERSANADPYELDLVGLTFAQTPDNSLIVEAVSPGADPALQDRVKPGDRLRSIDGTPVVNFSLMQIVERLRGKPGDLKKLELEREGKPYQVQARVTRLM
ncbi:MAG: aspartyl protease family protein [Bryobacteraceae bacterium]